MGARAPAVLRWMALGRRHPSALLLAAQLLGVLLYPAMDQAQASRALFGAFGVVVLLLAVWVVKRSPALGWVAWGLALPAVLLSLVAASLPGHPARLALAVGQGMESLLYLYAAGSLTAYMLEDHRVTRDELFAAGATFTLLAWAFAFAFSVCQIAQPGSFISTSPGPQRSWMELLYLSFSLLSGVGLSDVVPVLPLARALVMLGQFAGVMYIALVVSRLIGLSLARLPRTPPA